LCEHSWEHDGTLLALPLSGDLLEIFLFFGRFTFISRYDLGDMDDRFSGRGDRGFSLFELFLKFGNSSCGGFFLALNLFDFVGSG